MTSLDQLKLTFFDECDEALQQIETGLSEMRDGPRSDDTINAVFRAVHSVKGGAGIFGFEALVEFAHVFETVLDSVRRGTIVVSPEVVDVLLTARDTLFDLIQSSRSGAPIAPDFGREARQQLEQLISGDAVAAGDDGAPAPADFEGLDFTPVPVEEFGGDAPGERRYALVFRPKRDLFRNGNEPLHIIRELRRIGTLDLVAEINRMPPLGEIDPETAYLGWSGTLLTTSSREDVEAVFEFVQDDCELMIEEQGAALPEADAPPLAPVSMSASLPVSVSDAVADPAPVAVAAPVAASTEAAKPGKPAAAASTTTRIELDKIDRAVNLVGELVIAQAMLGQIVQDLPEATSFRLVQIMEEVVHHTRELKDSVMSMRAQPVGAVFQRMPRLVRELSGKTGKKVRLEIAGETREVDRSIIERLGDPLTHIIRNSVDHGIETPEARVAAGKPEEGTIRLGAEHRGGRIVIEIKDDGAGINTERVFNKAVEKGLIEANAMLSEDEITNLIMRPGFSTAETISDISGRGVGMDVVRSNIQDIGGRISVKSERGRGMTIQLALPLTLAVMDGMVIKAGGETYVVPLSAIVECLRPTPGAISNLIGSEGVLSLRGELLPLVNLGDLFLIRNNNLTDERDRVVIIADDGEGAKIGLVVDELCGHQQVVIKSIEESYGPVVGIAAATILGNGRVAFILDIEKLSELAAARSAGDVGGRLSAEMRETVH
ncbi:MAG: chemotaxis protein CheA [Pseudolabrys sp.]|nr:chemotaxis protein CheA [Pseudolabrys sp.]